MTRRVDPRFAAQWKTVEAEERRIEWLKVHKAVLRGKGFSGDSLRVMSPGDIAEFNEINVSDDDPDMIPREEEH